jgi:peptidase E
MRLVLFSGGYWKDNRDLLSALWCHRVNQARHLVYIPSWHGDSCKKDFETFARQLKKSTIQKFTYFPLDRKLKPHDYKDLKNADIIFFDGGNTYFLLHYLKQHKLIDWFYKNKKNKVFAGLSAGAICLSPNINLAAIPSNDADEEMFSVSVEALNLTQFEISPHFTNSKKENKEILDYSKKSNNLILALNDGSGVIIENDKTQFLGKISGFFQGKKFKIQS